MIPKPEKVESASRLAGQIFRGGEAFEMGEDIKITKSIAEGKLCITALHHYRPLLKEEIKVIIDFFGLPDDTPIIPASDPFAVHINN